MTALMLFAFAIVVPACAYASTFTVNGTVNFAGGPATNGTVYITYPTSGYVPGMPGPQLYEVPVANGHYSGPSLTYFAGATGTVYFKIDDTQSAVSLFEAVSQEGGAVIQNYDLAKQVAIVCNVTVNGEPARGAPITLLRDGQAYNASVTDNNGLHTFIYMYTGRPTAVTATVNGSNATRDVAIDAYGNSTYTVDLAVDRTAVFICHITANGQPVTGIPVTLLMGGQNYTTTTGSAPNSTADYARFNVTYNGGPATITATHNGVQGSTTIASPSTTTENLVSFDITNVAATPTASPNATATPSPTPVPANNTTPTPVATATPSPSPTASPTPAPTKTPSLLLSGTGAIVVLSLIGYLARKKR